MKAKILELLRGMQNDSKKESRECEKELCKILNEFCDKLKTIESAANYKVQNYYEITNISNDFDSDLTELPAIIWCNPYDDYDFDFYTKWLDIDLKEYFEELKEKAISSKTNSIKVVGETLEKYKIELENLKKTTYETLDCER